ncbi:MAG: DNA repair protein RecN [Dehalococcoidales bacterium]|nr:DNA repair protein RecN [Dehalococcoidales bacterium]
MLLELTVKNLGIIQDIDWKPDAGLNVITGETGAGKSLIIDAIEMLLKASAGEEAIRHGAAEAFIEGTFLLKPQYFSLKELLTEKGVIQDDDILVVNYEIRKQKPGIIRINGHPVTKTLLRQTIQQVIDIHGQSEHLSLLDKKTHLDFLDAYAHTLDIRNRFSLQTGRLLEIGSALKTQEERQKDAVRREEFLKYQAEEIRRADLRINEEEEIENERRTISFSEKLKEYSSRISMALSDSDSSPHPYSALTGINEALQAMEKLVQMDNSLSKQLDDLRKTVYTLEEINRDVQEYSDRLEHNPARLEEIEMRLELIHSLKRKYGKSIEEILDYLVSTETELRAIEHYSEEFSRLEKERADLKRQMWDTAAGLSAARAKSALRLEQDVRKELDDLEMKAVRFNISITQKKAAEGLPGPDGQVFAFNSDGIDEVEFLVSTNPGEPLKPLAKIASTGEISRFTLALKGALSDIDNIPVLIFDEIDIGIGGRSGDIVGKKLSALAKNHQVICVTHLPQIAAYADSHFRVRKDMDGIRAISRLEDLKENDRLEEMAAMLAGPGYSQVAMRNADELRQKAKKWKLST